MHAAARAIRRPQRTGGDARDIQRSVVRWLLAAALLALALAGCGSERAERAKACLAPPEIGSGFKTDFCRHVVPLSEFQAGGPGKGGIPAIVHPRFAPASSVDWLAAREPVIELEVGSDVRAYPLQILIWHEIANDRVGGVPVAVTFCPLCNTAIAFDRQVRGRTLSFHTTGNLRNSDLVMYDRQTESWWQQFGGQGVVGRYSGTRLRQMPARIVAWRDFERQHPHGLVLTRNTGFSRAYGENPYAGYDDVSSSPFFPAAHAGDRRLQPKERVVFLERRREAAVLPFSVLQRRRVVRVVVGGHHLVVHWWGGVSSALNSSSIPRGRDVGAARVTENGRPVVFDEPFWFAVAAFRPHVRIVR
jgi:hypothetical protein